MYTYVGKGTKILGVRNQPVERLKPGDRVLGFYIGFGTKHHTESKVKSVRCVGKASCMFVGSRHDHALIAEGQKTIDTNFKYIDIEESIYNVFRTIPKPYKVHKVVDNVDIYEIELVDSDVVPLISNYMFIAFSEKPLNFQGGISGEEEFKESGQPEQLESESKQEKEQKKENSKPRRKSRRKQKDKSDK